MHVFYCCVALTMLIEMDKIEHENFGIVDLFAVLVLLVVAAAVDIEWHVQITPPPSTATAV